MNWGKIHNTSEDRFQKRLRFSPSIMKQITCVSKFQHFQNIQQFEDAAVVWMPDSNITKRMHFKVKMQYCFRNFDLG